VKEYALGGALSTNQAHVSYPSRDGAGDGVRLPGPAREQKPQKPSLPRLRT
jgi:hypothetical protein